MALVRYGFLIAAGMLGLCATNAYAKDAVRLTALSACPSADANACIEMRMHWDFARTDRPNFVGKGDGRAIAVRGRLGKGRVRAYELVVPMSGPAHEDYLGEVAYLGRSREGRPIVVTDRGPLAIETRGVHVGRSEAVVIIDERARKVVQSYLGGLHDGAYIVRGPNDTAVLSKSGACVSPPGSRPGALTAKDACAGGQALPKTFAFSEKIAGAVKPAGTVDLAMIRKLLPQANDLSDAQLRAQTGRIGANYLVVTPWAAAGTAPDR
jgi:hypothetical protein